jgi:hypothetical protein
VESRLEVLSFQYEKGALWDVEVDPVELERARIKQKMYLARYARQDVFSWEHREVTELQRYFDELAAIVREENAISSAQENR